MHDTIPMHGYPTKVTARFEAKRLGLKRDAFRIDFQNGRWFVKMRKPRIGPSYKELEQYRPRFTFKKPGEYIFRYLDENPNVSRKEAITKFVSDGINFYTAVNLFTIWQQEKKEKKIQKPLDTVHGVP